MQPFVLLTINKSKLLKAVCHASDWVIMTIQRIGNLNGCQSSEFLRPYVESQDDYPSFVSNTQIHKKSVVLSSDRCGQSDT